MSKEKYTNDITELKPTPPTNPTEPVPVSARTVTRSTPINYNDVKEEFREYTASKTKHYKYHNTSRFLVKQILVALLMIYIQELSHPITKFGNVEPHTIIEHLELNYGTVTILDLDENELRMKTLCRRTGVIMEYSTLVRAGYKVIHSNGQFTQVCCEWRKVTSLQQ